MRSPIPRWTPRARVAAIAAALASLALASGAYGAISGLPASGQQVNDDPPTIDPNQNANVSDLTAGSLAGAARVPWTAFAQSEADGSAQIVVRAFKVGGWQTEGFPESLNVDTTQKATAPSIDFTGSNRTVPWVTWAEPSSAFTFTDSNGVKQPIPQIFASRFAQQPAPAENGGQWIHEGRVRGTTSVPSLNINTGREAADPSLIGGTTKAGANPVPWVTWEEADNGNSATPQAGGSHFQIFVAHAVPATNGSCPGETAPAGGNSVGKFCFQQVGIDRVQGPPGSGKLDPSLNVDPTRDGIQTDIAFTGPNDTVPWVVWYENSDHGGSGIGLFNADMVFAARAVADSAGDGGFHWQVVGLGTVGKTATDDVLSRKGSQGFGDCAQSPQAEQACSLDVSSAAGLPDGVGAENPQVTAGTLVPGKPTTPWITWDESSSTPGNHSVFVARLDPAGDHFDLLNNGQPISHSGLDSTRPDITFAGNTPYVSWHETNSSGQTITLVGHFEGNPADPVFHIDTAAIPTTPPAASDDDTTDVRSPIASTCPDDPFTADGRDCTGGVVGTPFYAFTDNAGGRQQLFAQAFTPGTVQTDGASGITQSAGTVAGAVNTDGARTLVHFDYGTTTAYGASTPGQLLAPAAGTSTAFTATLTGLPAGTTIHYRAVAQTDFGTVDGQDQTLNTTAIPPPIASLGAHTARVKHGVAAIEIVCTGGAGQVCAGRVALSVRVHKLVRRRHHRRVIAVTLKVGSAALRLPAGSVGTVQVRLTAAALKLLANARGKQLPARVTIALDGQPPISGTVVLVQTEHRHRSGR